MVCLVLEWFSVKITLRPFLLIVIDGRKNNFAVLRLRFAFFYSFEYFVSIFKRQTLVFPKFYHVSEKMLIS